MECDIIVNKGHNQVLISLNLCKKLTNQIKKYVINRAQFW